jgi:Pyruvate/2-oxoacid:ferredoxin oxidoreductase delta subunit
MMNEDELYRALQRHLDRMPVPYPSTGSGVEIRILKRLFTPEEGRVALRLSAIPEPLEAIHRRMRGEMTREQLRAVLERMAEKSAIQKLPGKKAPRYGKAPLVVGMYEGQVNRLTAELERDVRTYLEEALGKELFGPRTPQMRTVPVHRSIPVEHVVASYDDIRRHVEGNRGPFAVIPCICRQGRALTGEPCRQTREPRNCLMLGRAAGMMTAKGVARPVSKEEMLGFLDQADREGLVLQPQNTVDPLFVCCCCGCCCGVLTTAKRLPNPAGFFQADFVAAVDDSQCQTCGTCETRCQMDAIAASSGPAQVAEGRCIGCGLCVTTCPSEAIRLVRKERRPPPPKDTGGLYTTLFKERYGQFGAAAALAGHWMGRKF